MKQYHGLLKLKFLIILFGCILNFDSYGAHIVGGQMIYTCVEDGDPNDDVVRFEIRCTVYRDRFSGGAVFDDDANFGVYRRSGPNDWAFVREVSSLNFQDRDTIPFDDNNPCVEIPSGIGVEEASYVFSLNLDIINTDYMISYQRCCRNGTINNIVDPGDTGAAFNVVITPQAQLSCDNSPTFDEFPPIFICQDQNLNVDHSATDIDGDVLVYSFCAPSTAGGSEGVGVGATSCLGVTPSPAICTPPYAPVVFIDPDGTVGGLTAATPLAGDPVVTINPNTGFITGVPKDLGQYVVGVCVQQFRGGVLIGEMIRDFQFNVVECDPTVIANLEADEIRGDKEFYFKLCGETELDITNLSVKIEKIVSYQWIMDLGGGILDTVTTRDASFTFPGEGQYTGTMLLNEGFECADTAQIIVDVFPETVPDFSFVYDTCVAGPVEFTDLSTTLSSGIISYEWDFGEGTPDATALISNPSYTYPTPGDKLVTLTIQDVNTCEHSLTQELNYFPVAETLIAQPSSFIGCTPATLRFDNLSAPINEDYLTLWDFGDGNTSTELSPTHLYETEGTFTVSLEVISPIGCENSRTFPNIVSIKPSPTADFDCSPEEFNALNNDLFLTDQSLLAERLQWIVPGVGTSMELNPSFSLPDTGIYEVIQIAFHESGCPDTMIKIIDISPLNALFFPNAFTPNNDGKNDTFKPEGIIQGSSDYQLVVWNRWGEVIFTSNDVYSGWNGSKNNTGDPSPVGTYIYTYTYMSSRGETESGEGKIILLR